MRFAVSRDDVARLFLRKLQQRGDGLGNAQMHDAHIDQRFNFGFFHIRLRVVAESQGSVDTARGLTLAGDWLMSTLILPAFQTSRASFSNTHHQACAASLSASVAH